jgi:AcrR family transcriptional regulator
VSDKPGARERILAAAVRQIAREGIDGVRIARIAMAAGVSTSLVHYHFESRDALLAEALDYSYAHAGDARISSGELPANSHAQRCGHDRPVPSDTEALPTLGAVGRAVAAEVR